MKGKEKDSWLTPLSVYEPLHKEFNFDFDPCPYNPGEIIIDGLEIEWGGGKLCKSAARDAARDAAREWQVKEIRSWFPNPFLKNQTATTAE